MSQDLRTYLDTVKQNYPEDFLIISREVDPAFEITAITVKLEQEAKRRPIILFEKVKGTAFPVLTNLHAGRSRLAAAIRPSPRRCSAPISAPWRNLSHQSSSPKVR